MSVNLLKNRDSMLAAWRDVLDEKTETNWALFGYDGLTNDLKFVSKGDGGIDELIDDFNSGKIMYAFIKIDIPNTSMSKNVLINWQGEGAPTVRKGTCVNHIKDVSQLFTGFHTTIHARTEDDLEISLILEKLNKAGSTFNFKSTKAEILTGAGPVGTTYQKVNPGKEINSLERDKFWMQEEQEEKKRLDEEKKRKEQERRKTEEEQVRQNELAAKKLNDEKPREYKRNAVGSGAAEARQLIGGAVAGAKAAFTAHLAQGQLTNNNNRTSASIPKKPVRSSIVAQRISSLTQETHQIEPEVKSVPIKTSPIRNIDKIKMSLESPSQIQHESILESANDDLSPGDEIERTSFSSIVINPPTDEIIKQNIIENDTCHSSSSNENDDDDSDNKYSTIKRSPYVKNSGERKELSRQNTVIENVNYKKESFSNGNGTLEDISPDGLEEEEAIYQDLDEDPGLMARALYDYQAADETEITFDPGDVITHIDQIDEGWWQGLAPNGGFGLFPANYVQLLSNNGH